MHPVAQRRDQRAALQIGEMAADEADKAVSLAIAAGPDEGQHILRQAGQRAFGEAGKVDRGAVDIDGGAVGAEHPSGAGAGPSAPANAAAAHLVGQWPGIVDDMGLADDALIRQRGGFHRQQHIGRFGEVIVQYRLDRDAHQGSLSKAGRRRGNAPAAIRVQSIARAQAGRKCRTH